MTTLSLDSRPVSVNCDLILAAKVRILKRDAAHLPSNIRLVFTFTVLMCFKSIRKIKQQDDFLCKDTTGSHSESVK